MPGRSRVRFVSWILRIGVAAILLQSLFFKFTGAEESVYIFETLGMEPWGRWCTGVLELIAAVLLLANRTRIYGAVLSLGVIAGAIVGHLTDLGIEVRGDGGLLFGLAVTIFVADLLLIALHRDELPIVGRRFA